MANIRLQKYLANAGICSRREGERHILAGRVRVNGEPITTLGSKVDPEKDRVEFSGRLVQIHGPAIYIAINKPRGYVTSCKQPQEKIITDLVDINTRIFPIGRLDKDSEGLILLTNDGELHHRLLHPSHDHQKVYHVAVARPIDDAHLKKMSAGMLLNGVRTRPAEVRRLSAKRFRIVLKEGRNRQIRRMVGRLGYRVVQLKRVQMANIHLGDLAVGKWRYLSSKEKGNLLKDIFRQGKSLKRSE